MEQVFYYEFSICAVGIAEDGGKICRVFFSRGKPQDAGACETPLIRCAADQLSEYFEGRRSVFDLPLDFRGTEFQKNVWNALLTIPAGETRCYGDIAAQIGSPKAARAVGMANHNNPVAIIVPCHRVVGKNGTLVGYAGGLDIKKHLLEHEKQFAQS